MKKIIVLALIGAFGMLNAVDFNSGYMRKDGTYVQPHFKSSKNSTTLDNYSTKGNTNPYTGKKGTKKPTW